VKVIWGVLVVTLVGLGAVLGLLSPHSAIGSCAWIVAVCGVLAGYGAFVQRALRVKLGAGETLLLGAITWIFLAGALLAVGVASRVPLLVLVAGGVVLLVREVVLRLRAPEGSRAPGTDDRRGRVLVAVVLGSYFVLLILGVTTSRGNPYDDHIGYSALTQRLLDCGDLIEPFSFRRISAYGGQTVLQALVAVRGDVEATDLLDRGLFQVISILLVLDLARSRRLHVGATALLILFLGSLPEVSINSASTWTGLAGFLGAYGFASNEDHPPRSALLLAFLACAATCSLRQNYLLPAGLFALFVLVFHVRARAAETSWASAWLAERKTILLAIGAAGLLLLPYMIAIWRSNETFLYPILAGTANAAAPLRPSAITATDEIGFFLTVMIDSEPIMIWWLLAPFMVLARDVRRSRPWYALVFACLLGFVVLVHSFAMSDSATMWRYSFGYTTALAMVFLIEAVAKIPFRATSAEDARPVLTLPAIATYLVWLALLTQLVQGRYVLAQKVRDLIQGAKDALVVGTERPGDRQLYTDLQATVPAGARVAVLLDDPYLLDFARHQIINLDLPGFVAPAPGLPSFLGPERWRRYFAGHGIRYLVFVRGTHSTFLFRRNGWTVRTFVDGELWRYMGAHIIDALDTFDALAKTSRVLFEREGIVALDLGDAPTAIAGPPDAPELDRQDRYLKDLATSELHPLAWNLASRRDVSFTNDALGANVLEIQTPNPLQPAIGGLLGMLVGKLEPEPPRRWLGDRTNIRVHGHGRHHLRLDVRVDLHRLGTIPTAIVKFDGTTVARSSPAADGALVLEADVSCTGWCDLHLVFSSLPEYWVQANVYRAIRLVDFAWTAR